MVIDDPHEITRFDADERGNESKKYFEAAEHPHRPVAPDPPYW
jgi:hypothetical protein